jgi:hypothetical protein
VNARAKAPVVHLTGREAGKLTACGKLLGPGGANSSLLHVTCPACKRAADERIGPRTGPSIKRGASSQDQGTPPAFIEAVSARFGRLAFDLAANSQNTVCGPHCYFGPDLADEEMRDGTTQDWNALDGNLWINPPFANIEPWAEKCAAARHRLGWTLLLVPNSTGSNWYEKHVKGQAFELYLNGRIKFIGSKDGYPKDLALFCFGFGVRGSDTWRWNGETKWRLKK